ncbi:MAG TPA: hypothetical protein DHD79_11465 [Firmicutes bacterium]|jgi:Rrf2 family protein|nr:hypothetical protein [Bacillota bacterium]HBE06819.1 hypothetical protein [Bacillota bacterium]HBL50450.1 hypothetical protein [Bacillota bacterium]HCF90720.1 hypothetical protein [Bacillota bacterium]HCF92801.1 hypothetical protein [Bacillota bacterium]
MISLALHGMAYIANNNNRTLSIKEIASGIEASEAHLAKVMQRLVREGLAHSERGPKGGFTLTRQPEKITLLHIYQAFDNNMEKTDCPMARNKCPFEHCLFGGILGELEGRLDDFLGSQTLASFVNREEQGKEQSPGEEEQGKV